MSGKADKGRQVVSTNEDDSLEEEKEGGERGYWGKQIEFLLAVIGYAVGLGNLWRFPYLCMRNGGGAFLIPYFIFLVLCGIPIFFLELSLGQFSSLSPLCVWRISPMFKGIGYGMVIASCIYCLYSNIVITWVLYYLALSFTSELPWATCNNWWNTDACSERVPPNATLTNATSLLNETTYSEIGNASYSLVQNLTLLAKKKTMTASEEFWQYRVLRLSSGINELGSMSWELALCLIASWTLVFICLFKGVKSTGKVVYVTATVPYIFLTILLVRGVTLPGAREGIIFYISPKWSELLKFKVWAEACQQIFFSLGPAWGGLITMASYNKFDNNLYRDAIIVPLVNCGTSFYAGFVIFSVLGFMAKEAGLSVEDVTASGPGLVFMAYPEAVSKLPISPLWAILFFIMLLTLGLDSQFATFETVTSSFTDLYPEYLQKHKSRFVALTCLAATLIGLPFACQGGVYIFQVLDWYVAAVSVLVISFFECIIVGYTYGGDQMYCDIEMMIGYKPHIWWKFCWKYITPFFLLVALIFSFIVQSAPVYGDYEFPAWSIGFGWFIAMLSVLPIPICAVHEVWSRQGTLLERIRASIRPHPDWGPALKENRAKYRADHQSSPLVPVPLDQNKNTEEKQALGGFYPLQTETSPV